MMRFAVSILPAPLLNTPDFRAVFGGIHGGALKKDGVGLVRELEMIALPGSTFVIHQDMGDNILRVSTQAYPVSEYDKLYADSRFLKLTDKKPAPPVLNIPPLADVADRLYEANGSRYIWGGNWKAGLPQMLEYYPPSSSDADIEYWTLKGVDCSGLLYEAMDGSCPRNTSMLIDYGSVVDIEGLSTKQIIAKAKPLDYVVWPGHIVIFIEPDKIIQSRHNPLNQHSRHPDGVYIEDAQTVLEELCGGKKPVNTYPDKTIGGMFVMRRIFN